MNVLLNALNSIGGLMPNRKIKFITESVTNKDGFPYVEIKELEAIAQIQPLSKQEIAKLTFANISTGNFYRIFVLGDLANVLSALNDKSTKIILDDKTLNVFTKYDWSQNGWIEIEAVESLGVDDGL